MTIYKADVILAANSGVPRDEVNNTFYFAKATPSDTDFGNLRDDLSDFYNVATTPQVEPIRNYLAPDRDHVANHCSIKFYAMPGVRGPLLSPVNTKTWTLSASDFARIPLPDQVACVLSFHADLSAAAEESGSTRPRARRRGRIFLGPLNAFTMEEVGSAVGPQVMTAQSITDFGIAAKHLAAAAAADGWTWQVFSGVDWTGRDVVGGWVDDRFDTQRRRLEEADTRIAWSV